MKALVKLKLKFLFCMGVLFLALSSSAQNEKNIKEQLIKNLVDSQRYIFIAESVSPLGSERRQLTSAYFLQVTKDTITCDLPYFGRAYTASIGVSAGGFQFTSTEFDYKISAGKKKRENVDIKIKDTYDTKQLSLVVFENGYASLNVISNNRQSISYSGYITEIKK